MTYKDEKKPLPSGAKQNLPARNNECALLPPDRLRRKESTVIRESDEGKRFAAVHGATEKDVCGLKIIRGENQDFLGVLLADGSILLVVVKSGGFIALEGSKDGEKVNIAFRADISHARADFVASVIIGKDVTYQDSTQVKGEIINADQVQALRFQGAKITEVVPTWWTEDWVTLRFSDGSHFAIRADIKTIQGMVILNAETVKLCGFGKELTIDDQQLGNLASESQKRLPSAK